MKKTVAGKYYSWFYDETWEEALENHTIDGFDSVQWALFESVHGRDFDHFRIVDSNQEVVFDSMTLPKENTYLRSICGDNKFYVRLNHESIEQAISNHSTGYDSEEDALQDVRIECNEGERYEIFNHKLEVVASGKL